MQRRAPRRERERPLPSEEIIDAAFRRASRATAHGATRIDRSRRRAQLKIVRSSAVVVRHLLGEIRPLVRPPPTPFERTLFDQSFGEGRVDHSVLRVRRAILRIRGLLQAEERQLPREEGPETIAPFVRRFYGRLASFVREIDPDLIRVRDARRFLRARPHLEPGVPTLVVAGLPNVGKSSLVAKLSSARPKVAAYPFTTRSISVGHADLGFDRLQVVDTPGVLDRPERRNPSELEAEATVTGAANAVLFVIDPTETCGYTLDDQEGLLARWKEELPKLPFLEVETKSDLLQRPDSPRLKVSARTGEGIAELETRIQKLLGRETTATPPQVETTDAEWGVWAVEDPAEEG